MDIDIKAKMPKHIAIIMDGNGRWAKKKGLARSLGHREGVKALKEIIKYANEINIEVLTVYAFSTENWSRPIGEVEYLINHLLVEFLRKELKNIYKNNVKIKILGDIEPLPKLPKSEILKATELTKNNNGLLLNIALNYGGKDELINAFKEISNLILKKVLSWEDINEELISNYLYTSGDCDPDLIIRTGGEKRISNFLIWQSAYAELYFTDILWPDFRKEDFAEAIRDYQQRNRRFGGINVEEKHVKNKGN